MLKELSDRLKDMGIYHTHDLKKDEVTVGGFSILELETCGGVVKGLRMCNRGTLVDVGLRECYSSIDDIIFDMLEVQKGAGMALQKQAEAIALLQAKESNNMAEIRASIVLYKDIARFCSIFEDFDEYPDKRIYFSDESLHLYSGHHILFSMTLHSWREVAGDIREHINKELERLLGKCLYDRRVSC